MWRTFVLGRAGKLPEAKRDRASSFPLRPIMSPLLSPSEISLATRNSLRVRSWSGTIRVSIEKDTR